MVYDCPLLFFVLCLLVLPLSAEEVTGYLPPCHSFHCGKLGRMPFPLTNASRPAHCGFLMVDGCNKDKPKIQLEREGRWYEIINISQPDWSGSYIIFIHDELLWRHLFSNSCETFNNLSFPSFPFLSLQIEPNLSLFKCNQPIRNATRLDIIGVDCSNLSLYRTRELKSLPSLPPQCSLIQLPGNMDWSGVDIFTMLTANFSLIAEVSGACWDCHRRGGECQIKGQKFYCSNTKEGNDSDFGLKLGLAASAAGIGVIIMSTLCYFQRKHFVLCCKRKTRDNQSLETFLTSNGSLAPKRYTYSEVKKMTESFKEKLGQGGYGGVFKGKLSDGCLVAVKILKESKSNGEEFVNEVASIGRTYHVNIVTLLGFCFEGSKRALIYEFMANGSLEKHIYEEKLSKVDSQLGWKTLYQIAVGIARGLEYLHRGCKTRIVHFDIKPHNILLDENFCPKISDFGLAKICTTKESIVSMAVARGTIGYIAPEVFCRNFGGVSHKSDVYSYGMMVLEIVGWRKNSCVGADNSSEKYFPHWIYEHLELGNELGLREINNEEENQIARKMTIVSLWCIQTDPSSRPSTSRVIEMLQGDLQSLPIPQKPCLSLPPRSPQWSVGDSSSTTTERL